MLRVWGSEFRVRSFGLRVWGSGGVWVQVLGVGRYLGMYRVSYRMQGVFVELKEGLAAWCCLLRAS